MLNYNLNLNLKTLSRNLRSNLTDTEALLWSRLRRKQILSVQFYRQKPIGNYIVDFYAPAVYLVIELDGGQHFEEEYLLRDQERDAYLQAQNLKVSRFDNL
jgi:very-short-patch-repair endonuclease